MEETSQFGGTRWHRLLAEVFQELLAPTGVSVFTDFRVMAQSPEADILLLRKERGKWTPEQAAFLPDGIRDSTAAHILIEFKCTESVTEDTFRQTTGYEFFYRHSCKIRMRDMQFFIMSAKTPQQALLKRFGYSLSEKQGVYLSGNPVLEPFPLLCLNEFTPEAHNAFVKCFASRKKEKEAAFSALKKAGLEKLNLQLRDFIEGLLCYWSLDKGEEDMKKIELTPEKVREMGKMWGDLILSGMSVDEVLARYSPEDRLKGLSPEEVLSRYRPEERLKGLRPEERLKGLGLRERLRGLSEAEIEEYLREVRKSRN